MDSCIFCAVIAGDAPSHRVYENEHVVAFLDIRPFSRGHLLVVPRVHSQDLTSTDPAIAGHVFRAGQMLSRAVRRSNLRADGANLLVNDGKAAFQTVFHLHLHVVPRWHGDRTRFFAGLLTRRLRSPDHVAAALREGIERMGETSTES